jgi:hypothetical protein
MRTESGFGILPIRAACRTFRGRVIYLIGGDLWSGKGDLVLGSGAVVLSDADARLAESYQFI